jgi:hypothetical protein
MSEEARGSVGEMHKRRTTLADGRYLIYYTFGDESRAARESERVGPERAPEPAAPRPAAEEERSV